MAHLLVIVCHRCFRQLIRTNAPSADGLVSRGLLITLPIFVLRRIIEIVQVKRKKNKDK